MVLKCGLCSPTSRTFVVLPVGPLLSQSFIQEIQFLQVAQSQGFHNSQFMLLILCGWILMEKKKRSIHPTRPMWEKAPGCEPLMPWWSRFYMFNFSLIRRGGQKYALGSHKNRCQWRKGERMKEACSCATIKQQIKTNHPTKLLRFLACHAKYSQVRAISQSCKVGADSHGGGVESEIKANWVIS